MALIEWRDDFKTGVASIDYEHEHLITTINHLHDGITGDDPFESAQFMLGEIHALIEAHFALEEKVMRDMKYGEYTAHKGDHDALLEDIRDIMDSVAEDEAYNYSMALAERTSRWFGDHFKTHDRKLHALTGPMPH